MREYVDLKTPKHHFLTHLAPDAWKYGPPRVFWCFGFEAFNRLINKTCNLSNYKNEVLTAMQLVLGGFEGVHERASSAVMVYDPRADAWATSTRLPTPRAWCPSCSNARSSRTSREKPANG